MRDFFDGLSADRSRKRSGFTTHRIQREAFNFGDLSAVQTEVKDLFPSTRHILIVLLGAGLTIAGCIRRAPKPEAPAPQPAVGDPGLSCCWCENGETRENVLNNYVSRKQCEEQTANPKWLNCRQVYVESKECRLIQPLFDANDRPVGNRQENVIVKGTGEIIAAVAAPLHCDRKLTNEGPVGKSEDPRCKGDSCSCFTDATLPWNCEMVSNRADGRKISLGSRPKMDRDVACVAATCKQLFPEESRAYCPTFQ